MSVRQRTDAKLSARVQFPRREGKGLSFRPAIIAIAKSLAGKMLCSVAGAIGGGGGLYACAEALLSTARVVIVLYYALIFFVIALISGAFGFTDIAAAIAGVTLFILSRQGRSVVASRYHTDDKS